MAIFTVINLSHDNTAAQKKKLAKSYKTRATFQANTRIFMSHRRVVGHCGKEDVRGPEF